MDRATVKECQFCETINNHLKDYCCACGRKFNTQIIPHPDWCWRIHGEAPYITRCKRPRGHSGPHGHHEEYDFCEICRYWVPTKRIIIDLKVGMQRCIEDCTPNTVGVAK
jgi:hypothetical protein